MSKQNQNTLTQAFKGANPDSRGNKEVTQVNNNVYHDNCPFTTGDSVLISMPETNETRTNINNLQRTITQSFRSIFQSAKDEEEEKRGEVSDIVYYHCFQILFVSIYLPNRLLLLSPQLKTDEG